MRTDGPDAAFLEFIRSLLFDDDRRSGFEAEPHAFVTAQGFGESGAADVRAALDSLGGPLSPPAPPAGPLPIPYPITDGPDAPPTDLDAAIAEIQRALSAFHGLAPDQQEEVRVAFEDATAGADLSPLGTTGTAFAAPDDPPPDDPGPPDAGSDETPGVFEQLGDIASNTWEYGIRPVYEVGEETVLEIGGGLSDAYHHLGDGLDEIFQDAGDEMSEAASDLAEGDAFAAKLGGIGGIATSVAGNVVETAADVAGDVAEGAIDAAGTVLGGVTQVVSGTFLDHDDAAAVGQAVEDAADAVGGFVDGALDAAGEGADWVIQGVDDVAEGAGELIDEGIEAVGDAAEEVGDWLGL